jgi:hypothetical protein
MSKVHKYLYVSGRFFGNRSESTTKFRGILKNNIRIECEHRMSSGVRERHTELATLECIRTQCNSERKVAKYSRFFRPLVIPHSHKWLTTLLLTYGLKPFQIKI